MSRDLFFVGAALFGLIGPLVVLIIVCRGDCRLSRLVQRRGGDEATQIDDAFRETGAGIAIFDAHERLLLATPRYAELFGVDLETSDTSLPLSVLLQTIAYRGDAGDAVGREEPWVEESLHAHRRAAGPSLQRGRGGRWLCLSIGSTPAGGRVHLVTDVTALGHVRRQVAEEISRLARHGAFDPEMALARMPDPARATLTAITGELTEQVEGLRAALHRLEPDDEEAMSSEGLREAVGSISRLVDRYSNVERLARPV